MQNSERLIGFVYIAVHMFVLPWLFLHTNVLQYMNLVLNGPNLNLVYYVISFVFVLIFLFRFLKKSFSDLLDNLLGSLQAVLLAYLFNYIAITALSLLLSFVLKDTINPNTQEIINQTKLNTNVIIFVAVLLAPIVEETLFRGVLFGSIRKKSRVLAYIATALIFSIYHLWQSFAGGFEWSMLLYLLQYVPSSLALCWCYERSGSIWSPIVLHAAINLISIKVTIG